MTHVLDGEDYRYSRRSMSPIRSDRQVSSLTLLYDTAIIVLLWTCTLLEPLTLKLQATG
jgi:hypothetical protein